MLTTGAYYPGGVEKPFAAFEIGETDLTMKDDERDKGINVMVVKIGEDEDVNGNKTPKYEKEFTNYDETTTPTAQDDL